MHLLSISVTTLEVAIFLIAVLVFLLALRFFLDSQQKLRQLLPERDESPKRLFSWLDKDGFIVPVRTPKPAQQPGSGASPQKQSREDKETRKELRELKDALAQQQAELSKAIRQIQNLSQQERPATGKAAPPPPVITGPSPADHLQLQLEKKEAEISKLKQQGALTEKLQTHFGGVQQEFEQLQGKMQKLEQQAWQTADLAMKMDELEQSELQLEKSLLKKEERVRELTTENARLHDLLNETEDKLGEANLQRQQLSRKVQFLEDINNDIKEMADANRRLKTELHRVAELESMLNLITEERDALLRRR